MYQVNPKADVSVPHSTQMYTVLSNHHSSVVSAGTLPLLLLVLIIVFLFALHSLAIDNPLHGFRVLTVFFVPRLSTLLSVLLSLDVPWSSFRIF